MLKKLSKIDIYSVKFQLGNPLDIYSKDALFANYQKKSKYKNPISMSLKNQLSTHEHLKLKKLCSKLN